MFDFGRSKKTVFDSQKNTPVVEYDFAIALEDLEKSIGLPPRKQGKKDRIKPPYWMKKAADDDLYILIEQNHVVFETGRIVWCAVVQANENIFQKGILNYPGNVIYCFDENMRGMPQYLADIASGLFAIKGEESPHPIIQQLGDSLADEFERLMKVELPL